MLGLSQLLIGLVEEATRPDAARELARRLRCERLSLHLVDPETQHLAPLPGMPWADDPPDSLPAAGATAVSTLTDRGAAVIGRTADGSVLVALGGSPRRRRIAALLPQLALIVSAISARTATAAAARRATELGAELDRAGDTLRSVAASKDEFLATLSHELRTPLNAMLGWIQLLRMNVDDPAIRTHALNVLERSARAQVQIVADLLDVSDVITGRLRLTLEPLDVADVVRHATDSLLPSAHARMINVECDLPPIAGVVRADAARLRQIVWNLLSNAFKFTPAGGRVTLRLRETSEHVELEVSDTGAGITPDVLPFVFDRFRQGDSSITRAYGGLGLGLAIVRHLAELHGGSVAAASEGADRGATFTLRLPVQRGRSANGDNGERQYARGA